MALNGIYVEECNTKSELLDDLKTFCVGCIYLWGIGSGNGSDSAMALNLRLYFVSRRAYVASMKKKGKVRKYFSNFQVIVL